MCRTSSTTIDWTDWQPLSTATRYNRYAVYRIRIVRGQKPIGIARLLACDANGLLSIGQTEKMEDRRTQFQRAISSLQGHSEGAMLSLLKQYASFDKVFDKTDLQISFARLRRKSQACLFEELLIKAYVTKYGEVPPLNSAIPNRDKPLSWRRASDRVVRDAI